MTALWIVLAVLAALVGLCLIPVYVLLIYDETQPDALYCDLSVLGLRFKLVPGEPKKKKEKTSSPEKADGKKKSLLDTVIPWKQSDTPLSSFFGYTMAILEAFLDLLGRIVIKTFTVRCFFGGDETDYPLKYGKAWAVLGSVIPILEKLLDIRERDYSVEYDPDAQDLRLYFNGRFSVTLGKMIVVLIRYLIQFSKVEKAV